VSRPSITATMYHQRVSSRDIAIFVPSCIYLFHTYFPCFLPMRDDGSILSLIYSVLIHQRCAWPFDQTHPAPRSAFPGLDPRGLVSDEA
jgi:hypothetical protein